MRWRLGVLAGLAVVLVTSIPQIHLWAVRGVDWQGAYALTDPDELPYSAYLRSLIAEQPRRNNPYLGTGAPHAAIPENLFSIQFLPPYMIALPARFLGVSASTAFILVLPLIAFASSLAVFWLIIDVTGNERLAAKGTLLVLLCGLLVSESPFAKIHYYWTFAFLRRYIPSIAFPLFLVFVVFVWRGFQRPAKRAAIWAALAGVTFGLLVYSYFYLWTTALAWFCSFGLLWILARRPERKQVLMCISIFGAFAAGAMLPYFKLLSERSEITDQTQALVLSRAPDFFRVVEFVGALILVALAWKSLRGAINWRYPIVLFAASCAATPFIVFNQQIITGRSLQPFHYEQFTVNYLLLIGVVITYHLIWRTLPVRPVIWVVMALAVGLATAFTATRKSSEINVFQDELIPVYKRLEADLRTSSLVHGREYALFDHPLLSASAPTYCSVPVLWSHYMNAFGSMTGSEEKERFHQSLYYLGVSPGSFEKQLHEEVRVRASIFGLVRVNEKLAPGIKSISAEEIRTEVRRYSDYIAGFSQVQVERWPLAYVIISDTSTDLANLDRWYERDSGEKISGSTLYRVRARH